MIKKSDVIGIIVIGIAIIAGALFTLFVKKNTAIKNTINTSETSNTKEIKEGEQTTDKEYDRVRYFGESQAGVNTLNQEIEQKKINQTINGKKEGYRQEKSENFQGTEEGYYINNIREGERKEPGIFYSQRKGMYKNGQKIGIRTKTERDGTIGEYTYIDGKKEGPVTTVDGKGIIEKKNFLNDELHGDYKLIYPDGKEFGGQYINGLEEGVRIEQGWKENTTETITYVNGKEMGKKIIKGPNYTTAGIMSGYDKEGKWTTTYDDGTTVGGIYSGDIKIGIRTELEDDVIITTDHGEGTKMPR